jgi:glycosyltransferase involved in cell wall biosynthesis
VTPRISVVIPAYNAMRFLPAAVDSVFAQSFRDFEILLVDDGSTDTIREFAAGCDDPRLRLVRQENRGVSAARNRGIAEARGEFVAFLDADDLWDPPKLERQLAVLAADPRAGLCHTGVRFIDEFGRETGRPQIAARAVQRWADVVRENPVACGSTPLVRTACLREAGPFDEALRFAEDWDLWIRIAARHHFRAIRAPLTAYRRHSAAATNHRPNMIPSMQRVLDRAFADRPGDLALKRRALSYAYLYSAWRSFGAGDLDIARDHFRRSQRASFASWFSENSLRLRLQLALVRLRRRGWLRRRRPSLS